MAAAVLLSACSSEPARNETLEDKVAAAPKPAAGGSRLRVAGGSAHPESAEGLGCSLVSTDAAGASRAGLSNRVHVNARGEILWNGNRLEAAMLGRYLELVAQMIPTPLTVVSTEPGADPEAVEAVREAVARSLDCRLEAY